MTKNTKTVTLFGAIPAGTRVTNEHGAPGIVLGSTDSFYLVAWDFNPAMVVAITGDRIKVAEVPS